MVNAKNIPVSLRKKGTAEKLQKILVENDVVFLGIFGSFARGDQRKNSDLDIAIRFRKGARKSLLDLVEVQYKLQKIFGHKVDLGEVDGISRFIKAEVMQSMRVIYAQG